MDQHSSLKGVSWCLHGAHKLVGSYSRKCRGSSQLACTDFIVHIVSCLPCCHTYITDRDHSKYEDPGGTEHMPEDLRVRCGAQWDSSQAQARAGEKAGRRGTDKEGERERLPGSIFGTYWWPHRIGQGSDGGGSTGQSLYQFLRPYVHMHICSFIFVIKIHNSKVSLCVQIHTCMYTLFPLLELQVKKL